MAFTFDTTTPALRDYLRLAINDVDTVTAAKQIFSDEELDMVISQYGSDVNILAGHCMLILGNSSARIAKICAIGNREFSTDRTKVGEECRAQAKVLFDRAEKTPAFSEVALEEPDLTLIDTMQDTDSQEIDLDDLNT